MKSTIRLLRLHIRVQWWGYVIPVLLIYVFLLPYQCQILINIDEESIYHVKEIAKNYLFLFTIWFQYLSLRIMLSNYLREASRVSLKEKVKWGVCNAGLMLALFAPYIIILTYKLSQGGGSLLHIVIQSIEICVLSHFLMNLIKSAAGGLAILAGGMFVYANHLF